MMPHYRDIELTEEQRRALVQKKHVVLTVDALMFGRAARQQVVCDRHTTRSRPITASNFGLMLSLCPTTPRGESCSRCLCGYDREKLWHGKASRSDWSRKYGALDYCHCPVEMKGFGVDQTVAGYSVPEWHRDR